MFSTRFAKDLLPVIATLDACLAHQFADMLHRDDFASYRIQKYRDTAATVAA